MKLAGLKFTHGLKTTRRSVLRFMQDNPQFRVSDFYGPRRLTPAELVQKYPECQIKLLQEKRARTKSRRDSNEESARPSRPGDGYDGASLTHG